jgi:thioredoxin reductase (NADPH)
MLYPTMLSANIKEFGSRDEYKEWLAKESSIIKSGTQTSSPYCWHGETADTFTRIGGHDDTIAFCRALVNAGGGAKPTSANGSAAYTNDVFVDDHEFQYDCVVIGGGSGGLACSKEIAGLGKKVAVLDFVKPSPAGSTWGLGGTCVNVGCIPKKLMHTAALHGEHAVHAKAYGWQGADAITHDWGIMRQNIQDHIKGLNFGYRVQLREKGVQYMNKLGRFVDANTLEVTDKKGKKDTITARRFVVAVGGRPSKLGCPGGDLAVSSDDLFNLAEAPGKTCVIGAGYVALECAGFLAGLKQGDVTVAVRSIPLRGFDADVVKYCADSLVHHGTKMLHGVTPSSIEKTDSGKLSVTFSDGTVDVFDTVLAATGRYADTEALGLDGLVTTNPKNGKIVCTNEQSSLPNIYAIGDVVEGCPELTPVAIQAGRLLAQRLFGDSTEVSWPTLLPSPSYILVHTHLRELCTLQ